MTKEELQAEAALILEQEGWLISVLAGETGSGRRIRQFAERREAWQASVAVFRVLNPEQWPAPPDNS